MVTTQFIKDNYNFQSFTFAVGKLVYRAGCGIGDDVTRIRAALYGLVSILILLAMWALPVLWQGLRLLTHFAIAALPGLWVLAKALVLVTVPVLAMVAVIVFWPVIQTFLLGMTTFAAVSYITRAVNL